MSRSPHTTALPARRRRNLAIAAGLVLGLGLVGSACSGSGPGGQLLLADDTAAGDQMQASTASTDIWAVDPGEQPSRSNLLAGSVTSPLYITDVNEDGTVARDLLSTQWNGQVLSSYVADRTTARVTLGDPGADPDVLVSSDSQVQSNLVRRGVYVATADGCHLARSADDVEDIGTGLCQMSEDERWVVSWPADGGELSIRDLRTGKVRTVDGTTTSAAALGHGASVMAVQQTPDGAQGVVIDAESGDVTGRTDVFASMQVLPIEPGSTGFVALASSARADQADAAAQRQLLYVSTDADVQVVDTGLLMVPVQSDSSITYVHFDGQESGSDSIRRWDQSTGETETLLSGAVGATAVRPDMIVATKDTDAGVELYRSSAQGDLVHVATVPGDATSGSSVRRISTLGDTSLLEITVGEATSLARIDLSGDDSDVPARGWASMLFEGVDTDGTALVSGRRSAEDAEESIGVVTPGSDEYVERTTATNSGLILIHEGVLYVTDRGDDGELTIRTVRTQGDLDGETLYKGYQLAGATWPTDNGATQSTLISRVAVLAQQQQQSSGG